MLDGGNHWKCHLGGDERHRLERGGIPKRHGRWGSPAGLPHFRPIGGERRLVQLRLCHDGPAVVYDLFGRVVATTELRDGRVDLEGLDLAAGVYVVRISDERGVRTMKIVKE
ncbi:MAG: T9SS type A sorting domain-containing protein [Bacteroidales bacterium]|nr:T9SS type A sorting domain-containing protein [Bacteroidales bacterium]